MSRRGFLGSAGAVAAGTSITSVGLPRSAARAASARSGRAAPEWRVLPGDCRYETLSQGFNQRWGSTPKYIQLINDDAAALATLKEAVDKGLRPTVRGGGHCYENFVDNNGGVILDMSPMSGVRMAKDKYGNDTHVVEGGATNWDAYTALFRQYCRTLPAGSCYSVGAGGHICGGGYGLLSRRHGLTVDHLVQVDIVTVRDGNVELTEAHRDDRDTDTQGLFWAHTGGGGGNFGVILRYHFSGETTPTPPPHVWISTVAWPWAQLEKKPQDFVRLLTNYGNFFAAHSGRDETVYQGLFTLLALTHKRNGNVVLTTQWDGEDVGPLDDFLRQIEDGLTTPSTIQQYAAGGLFLPHPDKRRQMPWFQATMSLNGSGKNQRGKYKSAYHRKPFSDQHIKSFWKWLTMDVEGTDMSQTLVQIDSYGCQINTVDLAETAAAQRDSIMKLQYQTYWSGENEDDLHTTYMRDFYAEVYQVTGGVPEISDATHDLDTDGAYVNYPDVDLGVAPDKSAAYQRLYYKDGYSRLQDVKRTWDAANLFHHNQSIQLP